MTNDYETEEFHPVLCANELENLVIEQAAYKNALELTAKLDELSELGWAVMTFGPKRIHLQRHQSLAHLDDELGAYEDEDESDEEEDDDDE